MYLIRVLGLVIFVVGVVLLVFGIHETQSIGEKVANETMGHYTHGTMWYIIGGIAFIVGGLALTIKRRS